MGWADDRLTEAHSIERWWELVMCAYLLVSLQAPAVTAAPAASGTAVLPERTQHPAWTDDAGWKHHLVSAKHLHRYVGEFDYRYNARKVKDGERTVKAIRRVAGKRLMYVNTQGD